MTSVTCPRSPCWLVEEPELRLSESTTSSWFIILAGLCAKGFTVRMTNCPGLPGNWGFSEMRDF